MSASSAAVSRRGSHVRDAPTVAALDLPGNAQKLADLDRNFEEKVGQELRLTSREEQRDAAAKLKAFYFQGKPIDDSQLYQLSLVSAASHRHTDSRKRL